MNLFGKEPAIVSGALFEVVKAVIPTLIMFGYIHWTGEQTAQVMFLVSVSLAFFNVMLTRSQTYAEPAVNALIKTAVSMPADTPVSVVKTTQEAKESK